MKRIFILIFLWHSVKAICNTCQQNGVSCISRTSYQLCFGGSKAHLKQTFKCSDGLVCTDLPNICFQSGGWKPSCGDKSQCGVCNSNRVFACTGRTTFAFCFGSNTPTDVKGTCPYGYICDLTSTSICVPDRIGLEPSCNKNVFEDLK
ncbi:uncharacterized protein LOC129946255 [Eupeodes corollae]|uniref:uncharacterized protein LOC129946255 n=1 Tax=Eupeodes corollae TaxID=290404 RepID=UPI002490E850|nr:uncharacterized protein LOC129946255 [Eupeodes corollae]